MSMLPEEFSDLEPYAEKWCLPTETERWDTRMASSMDELREFYGAALDRVGDAIAYCDRFPLDDLPEDAVRLLQIVYSFVMVSFPVELWAQQHVPDCKGAALVRTSEPTP